MGSTTCSALAGKWWFNRANLLLVRRSRCPGRHLSPNNSAHSDRKVAKCWQDLNSVSMCLACRISITQWLHAALKRCEVNQKMTTYCLSVCAERAGPCSRHCPRSTSWQTQYMQPFFLSFRVEFCWKPIVSISRMTCSVLQCRAVPCSALQYFAVLCNVLQCLAEPCSALQCLAVSSSAVQCLTVRPQCVAVPCSALQCCAVPCSTLDCLAVPCSVLQCLAVACNVLQCLAVSYSFLYLIYKDTQPKVTTLYIRSHNQATRMMIQISYKLLRSVHLASFPCFCMTLDLLNKYTKMHTRKVWFFRFTPYMPNTSSQGKELEEYICDIHTTCARLHFPEKLLRSSCTSCHTVHACHTCLVKESCHACHGTQSCHTSCQLLLLPLIGMFCSMILQHTSRSHIDFVTYFGHIIRLRFHFSMYAYMYLSIYLNIYVRLRHESVTCRVGHV